MMAMGSAEDPRSWSGTPYAALQQLRANFDVNVIDTPALDFVVKKCASAIRRTGADILRESFVPALYGSILAPRLRRHPPELLFGVICSHKMVDLPQDFPVVLMADALFETVAGYYGKYARQSERTKRLGNALQQKIIDRASAVLLTSQWAADKAMAAYHFSDTTRLVVAPIGPNMQDEGQSGVLSVPANPPRLLFVGFDWERKGGPALLQLFTRLQAHVPGLALDIVGCSPPEAASVEGVTVHGLLRKSVPSEYAHLQRLYRDASLFVMLSRQEAYGVVFAEASSYGLPSIALDTGGVSTLVRHGQNGLLFPLDSSLAEIADAALSLLRNADGLAAMRVRCRQIFNDELNWDAWGRTAAREVSAAIESWPAKAAWLAARTASTSGLNAHPSANSELRV